MNNPIWSVCAWFNMWHGIVMASCVLRMRPIRLVSQLGKHNGKRADACPDDMDSQMDIR